MSAHNEYPDDGIRHQYISINGCSFHVASSGPTDAHKPASRSIFCVHGFPEGWLGWRPLMRAMPDTCLIAPDLRGYPNSGKPDKGYDVFTLTDDIRLLIHALDLRKPLLLGHDWGGALAWIYAHRYPDTIEQLVVVNCTHPRTLVRAVLTFQDFQTLRIPWVPPFQVPFLPEYLLTTSIGRKLLELSFTLREGSNGNMDTDLVRELVYRFQNAGSLHGAIEYYREFIQTLLHKDKRNQLKAIYAQAIQVPATLIWGMEDRALSAKVAQTSYRDAGCPVEWRPLEKIGHFVDLEASELLARELYRLLSRAHADERQLSTPVSTMPEASITTMTAMTETKRSSGKTRKSPAIGVARETT
jgi:pimeloyl-ACP methyl ester carboxylesterase